jgi:hypothetical protein
MIASEQWTILRVIEEQLDFFVAALSIIRSMPELM